MDIQNPDLRAVLMSALEETTVDNRNDLLHQIVRAATKRHPDDARDIAVMIGPGIDRFYAFLGLYERLGRPTDRANAMEQLTQLSRVRDREAPSVGDLGSLVEIADQVHAKDYGAARGLIMQIDDAVLCASSLASLYEHTRDPQEMQLLRHDTGQPYLGLMEAMAGSMVDTIRKLAGQEDRNQVLREKRRARLLRGIELAAPEVLIKEEMKLLLQVGDYEFCREALSDFGFSEEQPEFIGSLAEGLAVRHEFDRALEIAASLKSHERRTRVYLAVYVGRNPLS